MRSLFYKSNGAWRSGGARTASHLEATCSIHMKNFSLHFREPMLRFWLLICPNCQASRSSKMGIMKIAFLPQRSSSWQQEVTLNWAKLSLWDFPNEIFPMTRLLWTWMFTPINSMDIVNSSLLSGRHLKGFHLFNYSYFISLYPWSLWKKQTQGFIDRSYLWPGFPTVLTSTLNTTNWGLVRRVESHTIPRTEGLKSKF